MILIVLSKVHPALSEDPYFGIQVPFAAVQFRTGIPLLNSRPRARARPKAQGPH